MLWYVLELSTYGHRADIVDKQNILIHVYDKDNLWIEFKQRAENWSINLLTDAFVQRLLYHTLYHQF